MKNKYIKPGMKWRDTNSKPIQAHGLSIIQMNNKYYWIEENKEYSKKGKYIYTYGVRLYVSDDFLNWEDKGLIVKPSDDLSNPLHSTYCLDRPHIIYCEKTKKFDSFSSLSSFDDCIRSKRQGIISFWNRTNGSGDIKIDDGAHIIYIRKEQNKYLCFNVSPTKVEFESYSSVIADVEEKVSKQYIWGHVINAQ